MIFVPRSLKQFVPDAQGRYLLTQQDLADLFNFQIEAAPTEPEQVPAWFAFEVNTNNTAGVAALTTSVTLLTLPPGAVVEVVKLKHPVQWAGSGISTLIAALGITGNTTKFANNHNLLAAVADGAQTTAVTNSFESHSSSTNLVLTLTATGANLSVLTAGRLQVWVRISRAHT